MMKILRCLSAFILLFAKLLMILFEFAVNNEIIEKTSLGHDFAVLNADDAICKKGDAVIMGNHYNGLIEFFTGKF